MANPPRLPESPPSSVSPTGSPRFALQLRHIDSTYTERGASVQALEDISFEIADGEFVALIGPSGSGKSTLLDIVAGLFAQTAGEVALGGAVLPTRERLGTSAYMRQRDLLLPWRTALDNAALALEVHGHRRDEARRLALERFPEFGLAGFDRAYPAQLSGGMRQRVAFLRTVLTERPLLLLDEPFGALDALNRVALQSWLLDLWERERQAVLLVTHDVDEAIFLADRVIVLTPRPGRIAHIEPIALPRPRHREILTSAPFLAHRAALLDALGLLAPVNGGAA
ncbi:MAG TPA: ABC transporter ATP-binding protein [Thermomicrobiales bacterium]|nr:ABC transporter ATP-binding protein [Thermomicrobiales bacterium]